MIISLKPAHYRDRDAFVDACVDEARAKFPDRDQRGLKETATMIADDLWDDYCDHMEDLWERGVGPAWEGVEA